MVSINCLLFVSVKVRLFLEWFMRTLLRLFQPTISLRKMGLISRKIFLASLNNPLSDTKNCLQKIFPKSLDGPPNERKIVKLCEYASKTRFRSLR
nr:hypothetical protein CFP56_74857 [Quercus suber]